MQELLFNINQNLELLYWLGVLFWGIITILLARNYIKNDTNLSSNEDVVIVCGFIISFTWPISIPGLILMLIILVLVYA